MIDVNVIGLGLETKVKDYKLSKKFDDFGVIISIDAEAKFDKDGFETLLHKTYEGATEEPTDITIHCGSDEVSFDGFIGHNEGSYNTRHCIATKPLRFYNVYECLKNQVVNIFDYTQNTTSTIQGEIERDFYHHSAKVFIGDYSNPMDIDMILASLGGITDKTSEGYGIEYIAVSAHVEYVENEVDYGAGGIVIEQIYTGHLLEISVWYIRFKSATKLSDDWIDIGGVWYLNPSFFITWEWRPAQIREMWLNDGFINITYYDANWYGGKLNTYFNTDISNTYSLNEILIDTFVCSGATLVSNFLGINPDGSEPAINEYDFASKYCQNIRIVQSFDIIREGAANDSFGLSGQIDAKDLILDLNRFFNLMLVYDELTNTLRWEHHTYFERKGYDLVASNVDHEVTEELTVNKDTVQREIWVMGAETPSEGFYRSEIDYRNYQLNAEVNEKTKQVRKFLTDVIGTINDEKYNEDRYKKLFYLLSTDGTSMISLNNAFSIRNIVTNLHSRNRPLKNGWLDGNQTLFSGYSVGLSGEVSFFGNIKVFTSLNPGNAIRSNQGTFLIENIEIQKEKITVKIKK